MLQGSFVDVQKDLLITHHLKGKIIRVGHLGYVNDRDIISVIAAIGNTLVEMGIISTEKVGEALKVASSHLTVA